MEVSCMNLKLLDKRVVMRNIEKGVLTQADYQQHLQDLEDLTDQCEEMEVSLFGNDKEEETENAEPESDENA
jgi:hypothetical protein